MEIYFKRNKLIDPYNLNLSYYFYYFIVILLFFIIIILLEMSYKVIYIYLLILFTSPENLPTSSPIFD